jgi:hypothetical protein
LEKGIFKMTDEVLTKFCVLCANVTNNTNYTFTFERGTRYVRIVRESPGSRSSHCFIDTTNGNILKASSWKKPETKNPRGSIFDADGGESAITPYGTKYLR